MPKAIVIKKIGQAKPTWSVFDSDKGLFSLSVHSPLLYPADKVCGDVYAVHKLLLDLAHVEWYGTLPREVYVFGTLPARMQHNREVYDVVAVPLSSSITKESQ